MIIYEVARVTAPDADAHFESESKTTYTHFASEMAPYEMATHIRKRGNQVDHSTRTGGDNNRLIPWRNQVIYVNWRDVGDMAFPDGWYLTVKCVIDADVTGLVQQMCDDRVALDKPEITTFDIDLSRTVTEVFSVSVDAVDSETAQAEAVLVAEKDDMQAEWSIFSRDKAHVAEVYSARPVCNWCEESIDPNTGMEDDGYILHDSCWDDYQEQKELDK